MKNRRPVSSADDNADHLPQIPYLGQGFYPSVNDFDTDDGTDSSFWAS